MVGQQSSSDARDPVPVPNPAEFPNPGPVKPRLRDFVKMPTNPGPVIDFGTEFGIFTLFGFISVSLGPNMTPPSSVAPQHLGITTLQVSLYRLHFPILPRRSLARFD